MQRTLRMTLATASITLMLGACGTDTSPANDAGTTDTWAADAGTTDAGTTDAGTTDAGTTDAGTTDAGTTDTWAADAGTTDAGPTDGGADDAAVTPDTTMPGDTTNANCSSIADLKASADGPVNVLLCNVAVTYVYVDGYFVQAGADGEAIGAWVGSTGGDPADWPYAMPTAGDLLNIQVTEISTFKGLQQISASLPPEAVGTTDVSAFALDLTQGISPSEAIESRLVSITGVTIDEKQGKVRTISYGEGDNAVAGVSLYAIKGAELCRNATFDLVAGIITEYTNDEGAPNHQVKTFDATVDVINLDTTGCAVDDSNWDFEDWTLTDPPLGFEKTVNSETFAVSADTEVFHGGAASAKIDVTGTDTGTLASSWYMPVTAGTNYNFTVWTLDNDPNVRARLVLKFFDGIQEVKGEDEKYSDYSVDSADWVTLSLTRLAPEGALQMRGFIRFYDANEFDPAVGASINIDDWSTTIGANPAN